MEQSTYYEKLQNFKAKLDDIPSDDQSLDQELEIYENYFLYGIQAQNDSKELKTCFTEKSRCQKLLVNEYFSKFQRLGKKPLKSIIKKYENKLQKNRDKSIKLSKHKQEKLRYQKILADYCYILNHIYHIMYQKGDEDQLQELIQSNRDFINKFNDFVTSQQNYKLVENLRDIVLAYKYLIYPRHLQFILSMFIEQNQNICQTLWQIKEIESCLIERYYHVERLFKVTKKCDLINDEEFEEMLNYYEEELSNENQQ